LKNIKEKFEKELTYNQKVKNQHERKREKKA
jgi:hypothetical protein